MTTTSRAFIWYFRSGERIFRMQSIVLALSITENIDQFAFTIS